MSASAVSELTAVLGAGHLVRETPELEGWAVGGRVPEAVAFPRSVDELAALLGRASEEGWPVVPGGAGGWLDGGGPVRDPTVVVSTREMGSVLKYEPGDLTLRAEAGLSLEALDLTARAEGQWFAQDPVGSGEATLGAVVATGLPGPLVAGYGRPRDHLLGLAAVTGDGRVIRPGGGVVKNVAGYDLVRLLAGSWGRLGVVTEATVRLYPVPERDVTLLLRADRAADLVDAARALATAPVVPEALELVEGSRRGEAGPFGGGALLAARLLGSVSAVQEKARLCLDALGGRADERLEGDPSAALHAELARFAGWPARLSLRLALLPARLDRLLEAVEQVRFLAGGAAGPGSGSVRVAVHVTRGVARVEVETPGAPAGGPDSDDAPLPSEPSVPHPGRSPRGWIELLSGLRAHLEEEGGSLLLARAPRSVAEAVGVRGSAGPAETILAGLEAELDPAGILAPGRFSSRGGGA